MMVDHTLNKICARTFHMANSAISPTTFLSLLLLVNFFICPTDHSSRARGKNGRNADASSYPRVVLNDNVGDGFGIANNMRTDKFNVPYKYNKVQGQSTYHFAFFLIAFPV